MNAYNRWFLRPYGERKHQAQYPAEHAAFAALDLMQRHKVHIQFLTTDETVAGQRVDELIEEISKAPTTGRGRIEAVVGAARNVMQKHGVIDAFLTADPVVAKARAWEFAGNLGRSLDR